MLTEAELKTIARATSPGTDARSLVERELFHIAMIVAHEKLIWNTYCHRYGLKPSDLGKIFRVGKNEYKTTGLNIRSHKDPISCVRTADGRYFRMPANCVC